MTEWLTAREIAQLKLPGLPFSKRKVNLMARREGWRHRTSAMTGPLARRRRGSGGGMEYHISLIDDAGSGGRLILRAVDVEEVPLEDLVREEQSKDPDALVILLTRFERAQLETAAIAKKVPSSVMATALLRYALNMAGALL